MAVSSPRCGGKYNLFSSFSPWRDLQLRHFSGYPFGVSRKKHQPFSITQPIDKTKQPHTMTEPNSKGIAHNMPQSWSPSVEKLEEKPLFSAYCGNKRFCHSMCVFHLHSTVNMRPFSPVFPLAESLAKALCWLSLWNFKEKTSAVFYGTAK